MNEEKEFDPSHLCGAWEDSRSSDDIIQEIGDSRVDENDIIDFWWSIYLIQIFIFGENSIMETDEIRQA